MVAQGTMEEETPAINEEIVKVLDAIDVCQICQLRITGGNYVDHIVDETPVKEGAHCSACLGILEGCTLTSIAKNVMEKLENSNYDLPTFHLGLSIPQCVLLREVAVRAHLVDNGHDNVPDDCPTVKTTAKFFIFKLIKKLSNKELDLDAHSELFLKFEFKYAANGKEMSSLDHLLQTSQQQVSGRKRDKKGRTFNQFRTESNIQNVLAGLSNSCVKKYMPCPPHSCHESCECDVSIYHTPLYIGGRYNKYSRTLSQTPWFIDGVRRGETSVLELIGEPLKQFTRGEEIKFQSAGREDIDVQMLGNGRPFAVEILNPKTTILTPEQMTKLEAEINASTDRISIHDLQVVTKSGLELMKKGEEEKSKRYSAKLYCPLPISDDQILSLNLMTDIELKQKTPIRVLHRRPLATRLRKVHEIELKRRNEAEYYELNVTTQAGTYIKELVHGDLGRTEPSLRTILGVPIDIVELDVMSINLNWPPEVKRDIERVKEKESGHVNI